jgi:1,4-alpha-glucan branching enzyme
MDSLHRHTPIKRHRYSAKNVLKPVPFVCNAPHASAVFVIGDFNGWHPTATPMQRMVDGAWRVEIQLNHGHHQYLFLVDGTPVLDPKAQGVARNEQNEKVSLVAVS